ncbi:alkaline phosphatase family protein [Nanoarchaeota archaeon]
MKKRKPKTIFIILDGIPSFMFNSMYDKNELPNIKKFFKGGMRAKNMITMFPTYTSTCVPMITFGLSAGQSNIVGQGWYDKKRKEFTDITRFPHWFNDVDKYVKEKSLFEQVPGKSIVYASQFARGADTYFPKLNVLFAFEWVNYGIPIERLGMKKLKFDLKKYDNILFWSITADHTMHPNGIEPAAKIIKQFDKDLKKFFNSLSEEDTVFIFSDHGMEEVNKYSNFYDLLSDNGFHVSKKFEKKNDVIAYFSIITFGYIYVQNVKQRDKIIDIFKDHPGVEFIMYKEKLRTKLKTKNKIIIQKKNDKAILVGDSKKASYKPIDKDILRYKLPKDKEGKLMDIYDWKKYTEKKQYPMAPIRITDLFQSYCCGDIVFALGNNYGCPDFIWRYKYTHGNFRRKNMLAFALAKGPKIKPKNYDYILIEDLRSMIEHHYFNKKIPKKSIIK